MSLISKLKDLGTRTLVNTDIMAVQDSAGAAWYKINLAALSLFLYNSMLAIANTWTAIQTFSVSPQVPSGSSGNDAVNFTQLASKEDEISASSRQVIYNDGSDNKGSSVLGIDESNGFLQFTPNSIPSSSSDTLGEVNDFTWDDDYLYKKNADGWVRSANPMTTF